MFCFGLWCYVEVGLESCSFVSVLQFILINYLCNLVEIYSKCSAASNMHNKGHNKQLI